MIRILVAAAWALAFASTVVAADGRIEALRTAVQKTIDDLRSKATFPGMGVGVVLADGTSIGVASGFADADAKTALTPRDRFLAGSVGKMFVAAVAMQLAEEKTIALDDRLSKWLGREPWFARLPNAESLTVKSLLNHTSGLAEYFEQPGFDGAIRADADKVWKPADLVAFVFDRKPLFSVGAGWSYADTNYLLAGMAIEKAVGKPLFEEIDRRLLRPHKLAGIVPSDRRAIDRLTVGVAGPRNPLGFEGRTIVDGKLRVNPQFEWAGGGWASTPEDLARWAKLFGEGAIVRTPESRAAIFDGVETGSGRGGSRGSKYGLGVQIRTTTRGLSYGHGGWFPGYRSEVAYIPDSKIAIAVQFNTDVGPSLKKGVSSYLDDVANVVLGAVAK